MSPKPKLLIVVGSGASRDFGFPMAGEIDELFEQESRNSESCPRGPKKESLYCAVREALRANLRHEPNFEDVLYGILFLSSLDKGSFLTPIYAALASPTVDFQTHCPGMKESNREVNGDDYFLLVQELMGLLQKCFRRRAGDFATDPHPPEMEAALQLVKDFFAALREEFDLGFLSLNYDNVIELAVPGLFNGFHSDTGEFVPQDIWERNDWSFLYHLHGSVHFDLRDETFDLPVWRDDLGGAFNTESVLKRPDVTQEGLSRPFSFLIAGLGKADQILADPYRAYFSQVDRLVYEADRVLFLGYGFGDEHLNRAFYSFRHKPKKIVIVTSSPDDAPVMYHRRWNCDPWNKRVKEALNFAPVVTNSQEPAPSVKEYKDSHSLECSTEGKSDISIWHNGFLKACESPEVFLEALAMQNRLGGQA